MDTSKPKISVLGDSISTYEGYQPYGYSVYYRDDRLYDNGLKSVNDTWWMQVIGALGGELEVNGSFSGSMVAGYSFPSACSDERCFALEGSDPPDLILIYMGTNDRGFSVPIDMESPSDTNNFYGAYRQMLHKLKERYPSAEIFCATLPMGRLKTEDPTVYDRFMREDECYNDAIKKAVAAEECILADIAAFGERYETLDYCHPTREGHRTLAALWLKALDLSGEKK